jgi:hypothetical protein
MSPNDSIDLSIKDEEIKWSDQDHLKFRVDAVKGLAALLNGEIDTGYFSFWLPAYQC